MKIPGEQREGSLEKIVSELVRHPWLAIRGAYSIEKTRVNRRVFRASLVYVECLPESFESKLEKYIYA